MNPLRSSGGASLWQRARSDARIGAALILGTLLLITWIAWTVYVWSENGSAAGIGVLISWPAVIAAVALVAAPFVVAAVLVRRLAPDGEPALAGGAVPATAEPENEASGQGDEEERGDEAEEDDGESEAEEDGGEAEGEDDGAEEGGAAEDTGGSEDTGGTGDAGEPEDQDPEDTKAA